MALRASEQEIVKASLAGSIIGKILMVLSLSMLHRGWKHAELRFSRLAAESGSSMMALAVVALVVPAIYVQVTQHAEPEHTESFSFDTAWVLVFAYAASLIFQLKTHRKLVAPAEDESAAEELERGRVWTVRKSLGLLLLAAAGRPVARPGQGLHGRRGGGRGRQTPRSTPPRWWWP